jgi:hypothetical protein
VSLNIGISWNGDDIVAVADSSTLTKIVNLHGTNGSRVNYPPQPAMATPMAGPSCGMETVSTGDGRQLHPHGDS